MKLLVLAPQPFFQHRGTPIATLKMLHVLSNEGHQIDLLTYHEGEPIDVPNCRHLRIPSIPFVYNVPPGFSIRKLICDFVMMLCVARLCLRKEYHVIHAVEESVFMAIVIRTLMGTPYIYDMDSSLPRQISDQLPILRFVSPVLNWFEGMAVRRSKGVVAVCQSLEDVAAGHCDSVPIVRIEDASLLTEKSSEGDRDPAPTVMPNIEGRVVMYVGNLQTYQGIGLLLDAFTHVYHRIPDVQLVIVGGSEEDIARYRNVAQVNAISDRTHFLGPKPIDQLGSYLAMADILVSPRTLGSNTPMKVFSYLESGTPVLATKLDMHTQVLDDEISMLVEATPIEMARGMCSLLHDKDLRERISDAAQQRIRQQFCSELLDSKLSDFYHELELSLGVAR